MSGCCANEIVVHLAGNTNTVAATCSITGRSLIFQNINNQWQLVKRMSGVRQGVAIVNTGFFVHQTYFPGLHYCDNNLTDWPGQACLLQNLSAPCEAILHAHKGWLASAFLESFVGPHAKGTTLVFLCQVTSLATTSIIVQTSRVLARVVPTAILLIDRVHCTADPTVIGKLHFYFFLLRFIFFWCTFYVFKLRWHHSHCFLPGTKI